MVKTECDFERRSEKLIVTKSRNLISSGIFRTYKSKNLGIAKTIDAFTQMAII